MDFNTLLEALRAGDTEKATEIAETLKPKFDQTVTELKNYEEKFSEATTSRDKAKARLREIAEALGLSGDDLSADKVKELIKVGKNDDAYKVEIANLTKIIADNETKYKSSLEEKDKQFSDVLIENEIAKLGLTSDVVDNKKILKLVNDHLKEGAVIEDGVVVYRDDKGTVRDGSGRPITVAGRLEAFKADAENADFFKPTNNGGGGANGGNGGTATKKFNEYTSQELVELNRTNPTEYQRIKNEYYKTN